jgi:hypothetical protein
MSTTDSLPTRSFDSHSKNVVVSPGGQRVHKDHLAQSGVVQAGFNEVREGVWSLVGNGLSNQTFIFAPDGVIAIDTGESEEEMQEALRRLREVTDAPIAAVIYSHFHYVEGTTAILKEANHLCPFMAMKKSLTTRRGRVVKFRLPMHVDSWSSLESLCLPMGPMGW